MGLSIGIIRKAFRECMRSKFYPYRVGAVVFNKSSILGQGHNGCRHCSIHPKYQDYPNSFHAEQAAILRVKNWDSLEKASILVIRINRSNNLSMAFPCQKCLNLIKHVGIKVIYYSNYDGEIVKIRV